MITSSRRRMFGVVVLVVIATTGTISVARGQKTPDARTISRADALADLDAFFVALDRIHPAPYSDRARELVDADRRRLADTLPETMTRQEWWMQFARLVASLEDGHTELPPLISFVDTIADMYQSATPPANLSEVRERIRLFPEGSVRVDENRHLIVVSSSLADGINRGDRIVSINDQDSDHLVADWILETSGDSTAQRASASVSSLTELLRMHSIVAPYRVTTTGSDGIPRTATVEGSTLQARAAAVGRTPNFSYRVLKPELGYMDFYSMAGDFGAFKKALATMFRQIAADHVGTLIIDLRSNGGGYSEFGDELLRYVTRTPYRSWSRQELKRSEELRAQSGVPAPLRWFPFKYAAPDVRRLYTGDPGTLSVWTEPPLNAPRVAEPFFQGPVCVLTGPFTFSAAVIFADTIKTFHLATIVGEETGGRANMTLEPVMYVLPGSKFPVSIASGRSVRANGDANDRNGVIPDIVTRTTAADIRDGLDPALSRASDCPPRH